LKAQVILASNFRNNIDGAFCQALAPLSTFPPQLLNGYLSGKKKAFPKRIERDATNDLKGDRQKVPKLTGLSIMSAVHYVPACSSPGGSSNSTSTCK